MTEQGAVSALAPQIQIIATLDALNIEFACSPCELWVLPGSSGFLPLAKDALFGCLIQWCRWQEKERRGGELINMRKKRALAR